MRILLLGGFGFIGSNILQFIDLLPTREYSVVVLDKAPEHPGKLSFHCIESVFCGDITDSSLIRRIFNSFRFDLIIHAVSTTVPTASDNAKYDIETNLIPLVELLDAMIESNHNEIIYLSSGGAIYGECFSNRKHKESDDTFPRSSYGVVKLAAEKYLFQYSQLYGIKPLILRLSNPYGPFQYSLKQGITNAALRAAIRGEKFVVWGNGEARKDYIHIEDFCFILFKLIQLRVTNMVLNIASGSVLSTNQILNEIKGILPGFEWTYTEANIFDVSHFELNISELLNLIGPYSFINFSQGLSKTKAWLDEGSKTVIV